MYRDLAGAPGRRLRALGARVLEEKYGFDRAVRLARRPRGRGREPTRALARRGRRRSSTARSTAAAHAVGAAVARACAWSQTGLVRAYALLILGGAVALLALPAVVADDALDLLTAPRSRCRWRARCCSPCFPGRRSARRSWSPSPSPAPSSRLSLLLLRGFQPVPGMQFEVSAALAARLRHLVPRGRGRPEPLAHPAHHLPDARSRCSAPGHSIHERVKAFNIFMLLLEAGMIGVFVALDLFLFYIFWEAMLIPMYFLIGIWGHERRIYAAVKFFLYTMAGSALMLVAFFVLYKASGRRSSFDLHGPGPAARGPRAADVALRRLRPGLRDQGPDVPVPHLAARRPRGGAHRGLRDPGRGDAEDGRLRLPAPGHPALPGRRRALRALDRRPGRDRHRVRRAGLAGAAEPQEAGGLLLGLAPRAS